MSYDRLVFILHQHPQPKCILIVPHLLRSRTYMPSGEFIVQGASTIKAVDHQYSKMT